MRDPAIGEDGSGSWGGPLARAADDPIQVDELMLACCNAAYDIAVFHGAREVRHEHLLHALTRVPAAADILEHTGIRTAHLRRETAVAIASDMPAGTGEGRGAPRTSAEVAETLRQAAEQAWARHAPASIADLLRVLLGGGQDAPAAALLMQAAVDAQELERWRDDPFSSLQLASLETQSRGGQPGIAETIMKRLDGLESALQAMQAELAAERKATGDLLREMHAGIGAMQAAPAAPEHMQMLAATLESKLDEMGKTVAGAAGTDLQTQVEAFACRLSQSESSLQRLTDDSAHNWGTATERLGSLETAIQSQLAQADEAGKAHERDLTEIYEALVKLGTNQQTLGNNLNTWRIENSGDVSIVSNRLAEIEKAMLGTLGGLSAEMQMLRRQIASSAGIGSGLKRWLYGTDRVLAASWREETDSMRGEPPPAGAVLGKDNGKER
ncbi:MAG: hypothetical protein F9K29_18495 [Hyphomicrobiaceae bacterium]|nr:MAG: hypothetical protein F9K29_18495 [Hyphomicrobiaceae bacterium]